MNTSEILDKAADLIEERGLAKGKHVNRKGCLCVAGAMFAAAGAPPVYGEDDNLKWPGWTMALDDRVGVAWDSFGGWLARAGFNVSDAADWNDRKNRTKEEVVSALREAARAER